MDVLGKGMLSFLQDFISSQIDSDSQDVDKKEFMRKLLKHKPAQEIILDTLVRLSPIVTDALFKSSSKKKSTIEELSPVNPKRHKEVSEQAQRILEHYSNIQDTISNIKSQFQNFSSLEIAVSAEDIKDYLEDNEHRESKGEHLTEYLKEMASYEPPVFMDIRDISHETWRSHVEIEKFLKKETDKFQQKFNRLEGKYFYKNLWIKNKTGIHIKKLEEQYQQLRDHSQLELERALIELNDEQSALYEQKLIEDNIINSGNDAERIEDLPSAIAKIKSLETNKRVIEKKLLITEKAARNLQHKASVLSNSNKEMKLNFSVAKKNAEFLAKIASWLNENSKLTDKSKNKAKKYITNSDFQKCWQKIKENVFEVSQAQEFLIQKVYETREKINVLALGSSDRNTSSKLISLLEDFKVENLLEESEKHSFKVFNTPPEVKPPPVKLNKPPVRANTMKANLNQQIFTKKSAPVIREEPTEAIIKQPENKPPSRAYTMKQTLVPKIVTRKSAISVTTPVVLEESDSMEESEQSSEKSSKEDEITKMQREIDEEIAREMEKMKDMDPEIKIDEDEKIRLSLSFDKDDPLADINENRSFEIPSDIGEDLLNSKDNAHENDGSHQKTENINVERKDDLTEHTETISRSEKPDDTNEGLDPTFITRSIPTSMRSNSFGEEKLSENLRFLDASIEENRTPSIAIQTEPILIDTTSREVNTDPLNFSLSDSENIRLEQQYRHHSVVSRIQTPPEVLNFKENLAKLVSPYNGNVSTSLTEILNSKIKNEQVSSILMQQLEKHISKIHKRKMSLKEKIKAPFEKTSVDYLMNLDQLKTQRTKGITKKESAFYLTEQMARQLMREYEEKKLINSLITWELVIDAHLQEHSKDTLSVHLKQHAGTSQYDLEVKNIIDTIQSREIKQKIFDPKFIVSKRLTTKTLRKWKDLSLGLLRRAALRTGHGKTILPHTILDLWVEMTKSAKYIKHSLTKNKARVPRQTIIIKNEDKWTVNTSRTPSSRKNIHKQSASLSPQPKASFRRFLEVSPQSNLQKQTLKLPHI